MWTLFTILLAFVLDWCFGDPPKIPHLVVYIGKLVSWLEEQLRPLFSSTSQGERTAGGLLVIIVCVASFGAALVVCLIAGSIHPVVRLVVRRACAGNAGRCARLRRQRRPGTTSCATTASRQDAGPSG